MPVSLYKKVIQMWGVFRLKSLNNFIYFNINLAGKWSELSVTSDVCILTTTSMFLLRRYESRYYTLHVCGHSDRAPVGGHIWRVLCTSTVLRAQFWVRLLNNVMRTAAIASTTGVRLAVPRRSSCKIVGDRAFCVAGPTAWNSLHESIKLIPTLDSFKRQLKTYLFDISFVQSL